MAHPLAALTLALTDNGGLESVQELKNPKPDLGALLSRGYADHQVQWPLMQKEEYPFLPKPYRRRDFLQTIAAVLKPEKA